MVSGDIVFAQASQLEHPPERVGFATLMQYCWETVRVENDGAPNVHGTAELLYDLMTICPLDVSSELPDREAFVHNVRMAMLQPDIFRQALYPGALEAVETMSTTGPVLFWTTGDMYGRGDPDEGRFRGSMEQLVRVFSSGLMDNAQAKAAQAGKQLFPFNVAGSEDKFGLLPRCFEWLADHGVSDIVVLEDRLANLHQVQLLAAEAGLPINLHLLWLRQGRHGNNDLQAPDGVHSVTNIGDVPALLTSLNVERPGFLVDYDGVFSNDELRQYLQQLSVWNMLCSQGWIQAETARTTTWSPNGHQQ